MSLVYERVRRFRPVLQLVQRLFAVEDAMEDCGK